MDTFGSQLVLSNVYFDAPIFILMLFFICCSAFFSMSETAFSSVSIVRLRLAVEDRKSGAKKAIQLTENFDRTLTTLLVGNNIVNTAVSTVAVGFFTKLAINQNWVELVSTVVITITLLIFGEIMPKTIAKQHSEAIALKVAWPVYIISCILFPIVMFFRFLQKGFMRKKLDESMNEDELEIALTSMEEEGKIEENEVSLIKKVLELNDRSVNDIMVPRIEMHAISYESSLEEVKELLKSSTYSRIPVYKEDKDHIVGVLFERDFFKHLAVDEKTDWHKLIKPAKYVSSAMKVDALITFLQQEKTHLAIVSGEYGETVGLVTMEDALEELVGEIYDEFDEAGMNDVFFEKEADGSYLVDADIYVSDLFEKIDCGEAPQDAPSKLYSWLFEHSEEIPKVGLTMEYISCFTKLDPETESYQDYAKKIIFTIAAVDGRRIEKVKIEIMDATEEEIESKLKEEESE